MELLLKVLFITFYAIDTTFPSFKKLTFVQILILATVILSLIIAILPAIRSLLNKRTISDSLNSFMYSFLGGLFGGFVGTIIGFILGYLISLIIPSSSDFMFNDLNKAIGLIVTLFICWLTSILAGGIITVKPLIKFFSKRNI